MTVPAALSWPPPARHCLPPAATSPAQLPPTARAIAARANFPGLAKSSLDAALSRSPTPAARTPPPRAPPRRRPLPVSGSCSPDASPDPRLLPPRRRPHELHPRPTERRHNEHGPYRLDAAPTSFTPDRPSDAPTNTTPAARTASLLLAGYCSFGLDDDIIFQHSGSQSDRKTSGSMASSDVLTVNQLTESVHETAMQVANVPVSSNPVPYDQMKKSQCEALVMKKQLKMSVQLSFKHSRTDSHGSTRVDALEANEAATC